MNKGLRGRPRLNLGLAQILEAVRRHRQVMAAARGLGCSDAYIHGRLKQAGLTLQQVVEAQDIQSLLAEHSQDRNDGQGVSGT